MFPSLPGCQELQPLNGPVLAPALHVQNASWLPGLTGHTAPVAHCPPSPCTGEQDRKGKTMKVRFFWQSCLCPRDLADLVSHGGEVSMALAVSPDTGGARAWSRAALWDCAGARPGRGLQGRCWSQTLLLLPAPGKAPGTGSCLALPSPALEEHPKALPSPTPEEHPKVLPAPPLEDHLDAGLPPTVLNQLHPPRRAWPWSPCPGLDPLRPQVFYMSTLLL